MSRNHYLEDDLKHAQERAPIAFANHVVTKEGEGRWHFGKPGTGIYHGRIITAPGTLILFGDLGELMFRPSSKDALGWLRDCLTASGSKVYSVGYVAEKVPHDIKITEFQKEAVAERIQQLRDSVNDYKDHEGYEEHVKNIVAFADDLASHSEWESAYQFYDYFYFRSAHHKVWHDDGPPDVEPLSFSFLFKVEFLRYFLMRINEPVNP